VIVSELERPRRWLGARIEASAGQRRARAGRRVGRQAQMTPVLHSMADHIKTARLWSKKRIGDISASVMRIQGQKTHKNGHEC
jgi:hypothetical protein